MVYMGGIGWVALEALDGCTWGALDGRWMFTLEYVIHEINTCIIFLEQNMTGQGVIQPIFLETQLFANECILYTYQYIVQATFPLLPILYTLHFLSFPDFKAATAPWALHRGL